MEGSHRLLWAVLALGCLSVFTAGATSYYLNVGLSDPYAVGEVIPPVIGGPGGQLADDMAMSGTLVNMYNSSPRQYLLSSGGSTYSLSHNNFGSSLSSPISTGAILASGVGTGSGNVQVTTIGANSYAVITLTSTGFGYLVARYDGTQAGAEVWDISNLAVGSTLYIPEYAYPSNGDLVMGSGQYQITGWTLLNPNGSVPDGGTTAAMLGAGLTCVGLFRRKLR